MLPELTWRTRLWHRWKALRNIPFRSKWFVGYDLEGNSYWEGRDHNNPGRLRRSVQYAFKHMHYGDYKGPPQWVQWLRHVRPHAPSLHELVADRARQARVQALAAQAEQRWQQVPLRNAAPQGLETGVRPNADPRTAARLRPASRAAAADARPGSADPLTVPSPPSGADRAHDLQIAERLRTAEAELARKERDASEKRRQKAKTEAAADTHASPGSPAFGGPSPPARATKPRPQARSTQQQAGDDRTAAVFEPARRG